MPVTDYVAAASSCNRVLSDRVAGKGSPTSNSVVNSSSNKTSVTALATSSAISSLSTQLHAMLDGSTGESYWFVKKKKLRLYKGCNCILHNKGCEILLFQNIGMFKCLQFFATYKRHCFIPPNIFFCVFTHYFSYLRNE